MTMTSAAGWPGACDCHLHVFDAGYPLAPTATFTPPHAPASAYRVVQQLLGLQRAIVVQPTGYGLDNRCTLDAVAALGSGARGVAVVAPDVSQAELQRLHKGGMRGVRFMMLPGGVLGWDALAALAPRLAPMGWNVNLQLDGHRLPGHEAMLAALPGTLVIDHIGKFLGTPAKPEDASFQSLCRLLDGGRCWVKISAPYESSKSGPPAYEDVAPIARELVAQYPERCLWASNWPHPNVKPGPSNTDLLGWFLDLVPGDAVARRILVDNPAKVYGF